MANFTGKLLKNDTYLEYEIFRILTKHVSDHLSVFFRFASFIGVFSSCMTEPLKAL